MNVPSVNHVICNYMACTALCNRMHPCDNRWRYFCVLFIVFYCVNHHRKHVPSLTAAILIELASLLL